jgi:hypothetical protein
LAKGNEMLADSAFLQSLKRVFIQQQRFNEFFIPSPVNREKTIRVLVYIFTAVKNEEFIGQVRFCKYFPLMSIG